MIDKRSLVRQYRSERRSLEIPNFHREDLGTVVRYTPIRLNADGVVCFAEFPESDLKEEIRQHIDYFQTVGVGFEWKVYESDEPECLRARLIEAGFEEGEAEWLMVYEVSKFRPTERARIEGIEVRRLDEKAVLEQVVDLQERIWNRSFGWLLEQLRSMWEYGSFYAAYDQQLLVGTGWIEYPRGSRFAELHGGAVLTDYRGRGIYSHLFESRVMDALERGVGWIAVDAAPMSRPILETKGFQKLDASYPMTWSRRRSSLGEG